MQGSNLNLLKLLKKNKLTPALVGCFLFFSGCTSAPIKKADHGDDAASNVASRSQIAWETQDHTANADFHFALAQAYSSEGKVESAIEEYRAALIYDSGSALIHTKLAAEYLRKGSTSFAIEECTKAIQLDPASVDARLLLGGIYSVGSEPEKAIHEYEEVLKLDSKNDEAAVFKTQTLVEQDFILSAPLLKKWMIQRRLGFMLASLNN